MNEEAERQVCHDIILFSNNNVTTATATDRVINNNINDDFFLEQNSMNDVVWLNLMVY